MRYDFLIWLWKWFWWRPPAAVALGVWTGHFVYGSGMASLVMLLLVWLISPFVVALIVPRWTLVISLLFYFSLAGTTVWRLVEFYRAHGFRVREELIDGWGHQVFLSIGSLAAALAATGIAHLMSKHRADKREASR